MEAVGPIASGEQRLPGDEKRFRVVSLVAAAVALPFIAGHLAYALLVVPTFSQMYSDLGGEVSGLAGAMLSLGWFLAPVLLAIDLGVFAGLYVLAKRYWIGLLFVPVFAYSAIGSILVFMAYAPMFQAIEYVP